MTAVCLVLVALQGGATLLPTKTKQHEPPPPRTRAALEAVLAGAPDPPVKARPIHVVLLAGKKDHGPGEHDYPAWQKAWAELLGGAKETRVSTAWEKPSDGDLEKADVLVIFKRGSFAKEDLPRYEAFQARGGGTVLMHWACDGAHMAPHIGLAWAKGAKYRHGWTELTFSKHPVTRGLTKLKFHDETYWRLAGDLKALTVLGTAEEEGKPWPILWTLDKGKARVFGSILGHYNWTFNDPLYRVILLRAIAWAAREPVDRFNALVPTDLSFADH